MKRLLVIGIATFASVIIMALPASARLGIGPGNTLAVQGDAPIQVKRGRGHGRHMHRGRGPSWLGQGPAVADAAIAEH